MKKLLSKMVDDFELSHEVTAEYAYQLRYAVRRLELHLGRPARATDLNPDTINRWLKAERDAGDIADRSRANVRTSMLTLWKYSGRPLNRDEVRSVVVTPKNPESWHFDEMQLVAAAAEQLSGHLPNGVPRAKYFASVLWFTYETGLRRRDVWRFDYTTLSDQCAAVTQHKTRRVHVVSVTPETLDSLRSIAGTLATRGDSHANLPLRWPQSVSQFYYWLARTRALAGVDPDRRNRSLQHVRRTGATQVDADGQRAWRYLGHTREGLDRRCYVDATKVAQPIAPSRNRSDERKRA